MAGPLWATREREEESPGVLLRLNCLEEPGMSVCPWFLSPDTANSVEMPSEEAVETHSSILAWKIPWMEERSLAC